MILYPGVCAPFKVLLLFSCAVVGEKEKSSDTVNVRTRDNKVHGERSLTDCMERLRQLKASRTRNAEEEF